MDGILADWASYTAIATHSVLIVLMCNGCGVRTGKENLILNSMITAGWDLMQVSQSSRLHHHHPRRDTTASSTIYTGSNDLRLRQICSDYYSTWFNVSTEAISKGNYSGW